MLSITSKVHTCTCTVLWMNTPESAYTHINLYMYLYLHRSLDEHAMTESVYTHIICMYELLIV